ncbi:hypothetical protein DV26_33135 [Amycolatopsis mediterranei]|nr:hypothetical protein DV26_33135 [Amycolatopsis mediterranei]KDU92047.1 hypothetical protein DV36_08920 [Amycolatopsis mediterranei]
MDRTLLGRRAVRGRSLGHRHGTAPVKLPPDERPTPELVGADPVLLAPPDLSGAVPVYCPGRWRSR